MPKASLVLSSSVRCTGRSIEMSAAILAGPAVLNMLIAVVVDAINKVDPVPSNAPSHEWLVQEISTLNGKLDRLLAADDHSSSGSRF